MPAFHISQTFFAFAVFPALQNPVVNRVATQANALTGDDRPNYHFSCEAIRTASTVESTENEGKKPLTPAGSPRLIHSNPNAKKKIDI